MALPDILSPVMQTHWVYAIKCHHNLPYLRCEPYSMSDEQKPSVYDQPGWQVKEVNQTLVNNNQTVTNTYNTQIVVPDQPSGSSGQRAVSMAARITYKPFTMVINPTQNGYWVQVLDSPAGQAENAIEQEFSAEERATLKGQGPIGLALLTPQEAGQQIFESFFSGQIESCYRRSLDTLGQNEGLRINLRLDQTPELADLPWEALYDPQRQSYLALSHRTPLVRYMPLAQPETHLPVAPPLVMLVLIANPSDLEPALDLKAEWERIQTALRPLINKGQIVLEQTANATIDGLQDRLRKGNVHILHYIGHADFDPKMRTGHLILEDENGDSRPVSAEHLRVVLSDQKALRLAFLNACKGAQGSDEDSYAGIAQGLVQAGVPAVIGMRQRVGDGVAALLAAEFYEAVSDGYPIDAALAEARKAVFLKDDTLSWGLPVLFSRSPDNRLIDVPRLQPHSSQFSSLLTPQVRRLLLLMLALVVLITIGIAIILPADSRFGWIQATIDRRNCLRQVNGTCIVVARLFPDNNEASSSVTRLFANSVVEARKNYTYDVVYTRPVQNRQDALVLARQYAAPLILWGEIYGSDDVNAKIHLEIVDRLGIVQAADLEPFRLQHFPVDSASVTADIPCDGKTSCLSTENSRLVKSAPAVARLVVGLSSYSLRQFEETRNELEPLANCILTPNESACAEHALLPYLDRRTQSLILYYVGQMYGIQQNYKESLVYLATARELAPDNPALFIATGWVLQEWSGSPQLAEAVDAFSQAQRRLGFECLADDTQADAGERLYSLGVIYELQNQWSAAEACYTMAADTLTARGADPYSTLINLARVQRSGDRGEAAFQTLAQAQKLASNLPWAELELANLSVNNETEARSYLDKAVSFAPAVIQVYITRAELCTVWGDLECTTKAYAKARSLRPDYAWIVVKIGEFYQQREEWEQAQTHLESAIALGASSPWVYERLGFVLLKQEKWQETATAYRQAIQLAYSEESVRQLFCPASSLLAFFEQDEVGLLQNCIHWAVDENQRAWATQRLQEISQ